MVDGEAPCAWRLIVKAAHPAQGRPPRVGVPNLTGDAQALDAAVYCARGARENRIKAPPVGRCAARPSGHGWWANQWGLWLSGVADPGRETLRRLGWAGPELARAQGGTLRLTRWRIGAVLVRHPRRGRVRVARRDPDHALLGPVVGRLASGEPRPVRSPAQETTGDGGGGFTGGKSIAALWATRLQLPQSLRNHRAAQLRQ